MSGMEKTWQTPTVDRLDLGATLGGALPNADALGTANTAFPNPS